MDLGVPRSSRGGCTIKIKPFALAGSRISPSEAAVWDQQSDHPSVGTIAKLIRLFTWRVFQNHANSNFVPFDGRMTFR